MAKGEAAPGGAHSHHAHHHGPQEPAKLLAHAEWLCREKSLQFTPLRRRVFQALRDERAASTD